MSLATNLNYRVDFIPMHWYKCGQTPQQLTNYLGSVYAQFKRPMWVTEWNDGASWCSPLPGSQTADATTISNFVTVLESCPFVERYSIYEYFDPSTYLNLVTTNATAALTPAGLVYLNMPSKVGYTQVWPKGGSRGIAQFHFETDTLDSSGYGNNAFAVGDPNYVAGQVGQALALDGTNSYLQLPPNLAQSNAFTFAAWVNWNGGANGQHIFDFGNDPTHYLYLTPSSSSGTLRFAICAGGSVLTLDTIALPVGQWEHVTFTLSGNNGNLYTNGVLAVSSSGIVFNPSTIQPAQNYLGKSQSSTDPMFNGQLDEVEIADTAFTAAQVSALVTNLAPQFVTNLIYSTVLSTQTLAYSSSIAGQAIDPNPVSALTYSKLSGPAWLNVAADGTLTGTPTPSDGGTNIFVVRATESAGASAYAGLSLITIPFNANGVWNVDGSGNWSDLNNWAGGVVGNGAGYAADFSTVNITANRTVTLDVSRSIGSILFGDPSATQSWTLASTGGSVLTLNTGTGASPSIVVNQNSASISTPLAGTAGFTKSGAGTLTLAVTNTYTGPTVISAGTLNYSSATQTVPGIISGSGALSESSGTLTLSAINTYTGGTTVNGGTLNLGIGGSSGTVRNVLNVNPGATVNLTVGDALGYPPGSTVTTINIIGGTLNNSSGGNEAFTTAFNLMGGTISSSGGYYNLNGASAPINSIATNVVSTISAPLGFRASGLVISTAAGTVPSGIDLNISGVMGDLQGSGFTWTKSGAGTLSLSGLNTNTGTVTISGGKLLVNGSIKSPATVASSGTLGGKGFINGAVTVQSGGTLSPGTNSTSISSLTVSNSVTLQAGSTNQLTIRKTAPMTNDVLRVTGSLVCSGTLLVTNLSGTLADGDSFKIFNATSYNGIFTTYNLPTLGIGLGWNTTNLTMNGTISVIATAAPKFASLVQRSDGNFQFNGTGVAGVTNELDAANNLSPPIVWVFVSNAVADQFGLFQLMDLQATNYLQRFYRILSWQ